MSNGEYTSTQHKFREHCLHRATDGRCKIKQGKLDRQHVHKAAHYPEMNTCFCDKMEHPCQDFTFGNKLVKDVNAIQVHCPKCDYLQLVPKRGSKACKDCGYTRTKEVTD